jgi:glycosyltransferase involved in cell wall biosynthesis
MKGIWITWENQRRNKGISSALGWPLHEIVYPGSGLLRYLYCAYETVKIILKTKPQIVAAQNPSVVLATLNVILKNVLGYKAVIDAHNSGINPLEGKSRIMMSYSRLLQRFADVTIVTNEKLRSVVEGNGGKASVLPDRLPDVPEAKEYPVAGRINIAYICTFSADEPYLEVIEAARSLPADVMIYVTGKYKGKIDEAVSIPENLKLLGFIPDEDFWALLSSADFILDLTLREDCLVCGAYEGVALGKPLILSDTKALRTYFHRGCAYVSSTSESISAGIRKAIEQREVLNAEVSRLKEEINKTWDGTLENFKMMVGDLGCPD